MSKETEVAVVVPTDGDHRVINREEATKGCCETLKSFVTPKSIVAAIIWFGMAATFIYLLSSGIIDDLQEYILGIGYGGYAIFFFMYILVGQPFGWGYQATTILCGFIYGWPGLAICQVSTHVSAGICFFEVRYFAREFVQKRVDQLQPKLQLMVKKLEVVATKNIRTSYPFMIGARQTPITFGLINSIFGLTEVSYIRYFFTTVFGTMIEAPISINIGVLLRASFDLLEETKEQLGENATAVDTEAEKEAEELEQISFIISVIITVLVVLGSAAYTRWFMKQLSNASEDDIWQEIQKIDEEDDEEIDNVFGSVGHHSSDRELSM